MSRFSLESCLDPRLWSASLPPDPPVSVARFELEAPWDGLSPLGDLTPDQWEALLLNEGLWIDGCPYGKREQGEGRAAGAVVRIYRFETPPKPLDCELQILWQAPKMAAFYKPSGLSVCRTRASAIRCMEYLVQQRLGQSWRAVHRLDRNTSGVILFAEDQASTACLHRAFRKNRVDKRYLALVSPPPKEDSFEVEGYLARAVPPSPDPAPLTFVLWKSLEEAPKDRTAQWSKTAFRVLARSDQTALVEAHLFTGRTHQIRVHLQSVGSPVMGDDLYDGAPASRLMLHARSIALWGDVNFEVTAEVFGPDVNPRD